MLFEAPELTHREQLVLQYTIQDFIVTAMPVASGTIVKKHRLNVSPATVRNDMHSLENKGYLDHPHTSAGRVPTEMGYRFYVNSLMQATNLTRDEQIALDSVRESIEAGAMDDALIGGARLLARLSNLLAVNIAPKLAEGIFRKIEMVSLSSSRLLILLTIESGLIRTINIEVESEINRNDLDRVTSVLNERLSGRVLREIKSGIHEMLADFREQDDTGIIRVFIDRADTIFEDQQIRRFHFGGAEYMALQPEFSDLRNYRSIIEVIEKEDLIVHLFDDENAAMALIEPSKASVRIGSENKIRQMEQCSVVSAKYHIGNITGTIGLVGPTRMDYGRMISLVEQLAGRLNRPIQNS